MAAPPVKQQKLLERQLELLEERRARLAARESLLAFTEYTHPNWATGDHHIKICDHLEALVRGDIKRLMIFAPPRHGKSELVSKRLPAWYFGKHPDHQIIAASHTDLLASDVGTDVRKIVDDQYYRNIFPGVELEKDAQAGGRWRLTAGGIYIGAGVGGAIPGRGAHLAILDDLVRGRNDAESERMREVTWRWYLGDLYQRLMPDGKIVLIMTRWHCDDIAGRALKSDDWTVLRLRAIENEDTDNEQALFPHPDWWPLDRLHEKKRVMTKGGRIREWTAQYQQEPSVEDGTYIRRDWFHARYKHTPDRINVYMASDFAVTEAREGADPDWTEHGVFGVGPDGSTLYVLDWWCGQTTADVWIEELLELIRKWKPSAWFGEAGTIRRSIDPFLTKRSRETKTFFRKEWVASTKDKATRGRAFQARASMGNVVFPENEAWSDRIIEQCVQFPAGNHDDAFDTLSLMCLVIDEAHPAVLQWKSTKRVDRYNTSPEARRNWKTV